MRFVVKTYLFLQRFKVFLVVFLPLGLIIESAIANGWVYANGTFSNPFTAAVAIGRGFFFEVLTYGAALLAKLLFENRPTALGHQRSRQESVIGGSIMSVITVIAILVSAGNNLGWVLGGHELGGVFGALGALMPGFLFAPYELGLAILLPVSVAAIALVDTVHAVHDMLDNSHLHRQSVLLEESEMHQGEYLRGLRAQKDTLAEEYGDIAADRAQTIISQVRSGDFSFGAPVTRQLPSSSSNPMIQSPNYVEGTVWPADQDEGWR